MLTLLLWLFFCFVSCLVSPCVPVDLFSFGLVQLYHFLCSFLFWRVAVVVVVVVAEVGGCGLGCSFACSLFILRQIGEGKKLNASRQKHLQSRLAEQATQI